MPPQLRGGGGDRSLVRVFTGAWVGTVVGVAFAGNLEQPARATARMHSHASHWVGMGRVLVFILFFWGRPDETFGVFRNPEGLLGHAWLFYHQKRVPGHLSAGWVCRGDAAGTDHRWRRPYPHFSKTVVYSPRSWKGAILPRWGQYSHQRPDGKRKDGRIHRRPTTHVP